MGGNIMTIEIIFFNSNEEAKIDKRKRRGVWRPLETITVDNKIKVTFVNGIDDPDNSDEYKQKQIKFKRKKTLNSKLQDDSITFNELKELMRG
tara:strand:+ start:377 stop:655 length:279 start_codon:yes stop_codon:yes gene_type:complete